MREVRGRRPHNQSLRNDVSMPCEKSQMHILCVARQWQASKYRRPVSQSDLKQGNRATVPGPLHKRRSREHRAAIIGRHREATRRHQEGQIARSEGNVTHLRTIEPDAKDSASMPACEVGDECARRSVPDLCPSRPMINRSIIQPLAFTDSNFGNTLQHEPLP